MSNDQDEFLKELLADFRIEATEHYNSILEGVLLLEKNGLSTPDKSIIEKVYRCTHSLKGAARAVNLLDIEKLCMAAETIFNSLKKGESVLNPSLFDVLYKALDVLKLLLSNYDKTGGGGTNINLAQIIRHLEFVQKSSLSQAGSIENTVPELAASPETEPAEIIIPEKDIQEKEDDTIRISSGKLNRLLRETEDFVVVKSAIEFYKKELSQISSRYKDENLTYIYEDMVRFQNIANRMVDDLIIGIKSTLLSPFSTILNIVPKIVRDLSKESSKSISVSIKDDYYEIDRRILEEIKDPLIHLIRNCVDHGIETVKEREAKGKPSQGNLNITVRKEADRKISLIIEDDGKGIDSEKILKSAVKNGIIEESRLGKMSENEIYSLIFKSGVSSSEMITEISGRGLGMAIVAEKVSNLGGTIDVKSRKGFGSTFTITLPQTIATFRGIIIVVDGKSYMVPSIFLERAILIKPQEVKSIGGRNVITVNDTTIGYISMREALGVEKVKTETNSDRYLNVMILSVNNSRLAFSVDEILEEQEGIVKDLGPMLNQLKKITGVTILANGVIVPVININEIIGKISFNSHYEAGQEREAEAQQENGQKKILVVEDSITVRTMLKTIIENGGYIVKTAFDGQDGLETLLNESFDLLVTDIEMPRLNGFELTEKVRENSAFTDLPIILVTTLDKPEDKRRGLESGANAYIVKGSFEKSNLIETIRRLI